MNGAYWRLWHAWPDDQKAKRPDVPDYVSPPRATAEEIQAELDKTKAAQVTPA